MRRMTIQRGDLSALSDAVLGSGGRLAFVARGGSMYPFIRDGDELTIEPTCADRLRVGDIAFYRSVGSAMVAHRVVKRRRDGGGIVFLARGDSTLESCEVVRAEQVLGRAVSLRRGDRVVLLDSGWLRVAGILWVFLHPLGLRLLSTVSACRRFAR